MYSSLVQRHPQAAATLPAEVAADVPRNGLRMVAAGALQSSGDQTVNASTVLPWLFTALGVPAGLIGVLVPIRESGSMLPQAFLTPLVTRVRHRTWVFVAGALVQAAMVAVMALTAAVGHGLSAGLVIVAALAVFSLGRCLCSISSKDVQGRTLPKGERGQVNGLATTASGLVAITLGLAIRMFGGDELRADQLAWLLGAGAALWVLVALLYAGLREPAPEHHGEGAAQAEGAGSERRTDTPSGTWALLRDDRPFRHFVVVRSMLLVSSLSPPFVVALAVADGSPGLAGLGAFILASGVASLLGGRVFGKRADASSRTLMLRGAGAASAVILALLAAATLPGFSGSSTLGTLLFVAAYFLITFLHTGVRVGRKTYVVDMAEGDRRTAYVAVSNSVMGLMLLLVGAVTSLLAVVSVALALAVLAAMGILGVLLGRGLPEVSAR